MDAIRTGDVQRLEWLLKNGLNADERTDDGTLLGVAAREGNVDCLECLLRAGADVNLPIRAGLHLDIHFRCVKAHPDERDSGSSRSRVVPIL